MVVKQEIKGCQMVTLEAKAVKVLLVVPAAAAAEKRKAVVGVVIPVEVVLLEQVLVPAAMDTQEPMVGKVATVSVPISVTIKSEIVTSILIQPETGLLQ